MHDAETNMIRNIWKKLFVIIHIDLNGSCITVTGDISKSAIFTHGTTEKQSNVVMVQLLGMCISITEANAIHISMHSQQYDTLKLHMKQVPMRYDSPL